MKKKKRVSPMKGRKISEEERGPDAPKLGRPFNYDGPVKKYVISLSIPEDKMEKFLKKRGGSKGTAIRQLIEEDIG